MHEAIRVGVQALVDVEHVLQSVVVRVTDVRFRVYHQPGLTLGREHVARVQVGREQCRWHRVERQRPEQS